MRELTMQFAKSKNGKIKISQMAVSEMLKFAQTSPSSVEAGGILLGRHILKSNDIVIDEITTPMSNDKRRRFSFFRSKNQHQEKLEEKWRASIETCNYLGEWHSHPQNVPEPSPIDFQNWKRILSKALFDSDSLFFIIVGKSRLCIWEGFRKNQTIIQLKKTGGNDAYSLVTII